jgi:transposase
MALRVRELTKEEQAKIERLVSSQTAPVRLVRRAWIVKLSSEGASALEIARRLEVAEKVPRLWIRRFNVQGLDALDDAPRSGRPETYTEEEKSRVIAKARGLPPKPEGPEGQELPPTCHWTLDLLERELNKEGLAIRRSQIRRILQAEHVKWQRPRTWLESDDPEFAAKRGRSSSSTSSHQLAARS